MIPILVDCIIGDIQVTSAVVN